MADGALTPAQAAAALLHRRRARDSLTGFVESIEIPGAPLSDDEDEGLFEPVGTAMAAHHRLLCEELQRCMTTRYGRLMVFMPPGASKSTYCSVVAPAWFMGKFPGSKIILASHNTELAKKQGRKARAVVRQSVFSECFQSTLSKETAAAEMWSLSNGSEYMGAGILSGVTGNRANCFPAGTMVSTPIGPVAIESLVIGDDVISFDIGNNCYTTAKVMATRREWSNGELVEIKSEQGATLRSTPEHRIYCARQGYREAQLLGTGDSLLRAPEGCRVNALLGLLQRATLERGASAMRALSIACRLASLRLREAMGSWGEKFFLQPDVLPHIAARGGCAGVQGMREAADWHWQMVLRNGLYAEANKPRHHKNMPAMRGDVSRPIASHSILHKNMRQSSAFNANGRFWQLAFQGRDKLRGMVQAYASNYFGSGRATLRRMHVSKSVTSASLRRESAEQRAREPDNSLQSMSYSASQVSHDSVSVARRISEGPIFVYDIQIEKTECFFANEILVHNCLIIDDPIRGRKDADSPTVRKSTLEAYQDDLMTRMVPGGCIVLVQTRWHTADLAGSLLPEDYDGQSGDVLCRDGLVWRVLNIPAEAIRADDPLGRRKGEMLWPEWFDERHWLPFRKNPRTWSALCQQNPVPDSGGQFEREWFKWYQPGDKPLYMNRFTASDYAVTAEEDGKDPDYTEHGCAGVDPQGGLWLLDWWYGRTATDISIDALLRMAQRNKARRGFGEVGVIRRAIEPAFKRRQRELRIPLSIEYLPHIGDKTARVQSFRALASSGQVYLPLGVPWAERLVDQLCGFPAVAHDDGVDVCSLFGRALDEMAYGRIPQEENVDEGLRPFSWRWLVHGTDGPSGPPKPRVM